MVEKPALWEYLLFAEVLKDNLNKLDDLRYDMKYGISFERTVCFENPIEIFDYVQAKSKELIRKNDILCVILPSLTVGKIKMATNPVNMGSVAVFYFVTICAIL